MAKKKIDTTPKTQHHIPHPHHPHHHKQPDSRAPLHPPRHPSQTQRQITPDAPGYPPHGRVQQANKQDEDDMIKPQQPSAMPKPPPPSLPKPALPRNTAFDPWNSSSTGHQRPEHQPGTAWRVSRTGKLNSQFQSGPAGGPRTQDSWGPGGAVVKGRRGTSVVDMLKTPGLMGESLLGSRRDERDAFGGGETLAQEASDSGARVAAAASRGIFAGCVVYVNGSTYPLVSDHKLKHVLCENGAQVSVHLGRRRVTHVVLGRPAGGGLAAGKMEREMRRIGGVGVQFVGVEWVLESLKAGRRLPEARFSNVKLAAKGQGSVYGLYSGNGVAGGRLS